MNFRKFRSRSREEFLPSKSLQCSGPTPPSLERPAQEKPSYTVKMRIDPYERKGRASGAGERRPAKGGWRLEKRGRSVRGTARREENLPPRRNGKRTYDDPVNLPRRSFAGESRGSKNRRHDRLASAVPQHAGRMDRQSFFPFCRSSVLAPFQQSPRRGRGRRSGEKPIKRSETRLRASLPRIDPDRVPFR